MKKVTLLLTLLFVFNLNAQEAPKENRLDFNLNIQSNHLWRGLIITDQPMVAVNLHYTLDKKKHFKVGVWGGSSFSSEYSETLGYETHYQEIDYYVQYSNKKISIGLWDLFNTKNIENPDIWDYNDKTSTHILDLRTNYQFGKKFPLRLEADILLFGTVDQDIDGNNRYSTYLEAKYPIIKNQKVNLDAFVGTGFSFNGDTHLYGNGENNFDITNLGVTASKTLSISSFKLPVSATTMWNPSKEYARIQIAATLF